jgi:hypothetical protein
MTRQGKPSANQVMFSTCWMAQVMSSMDSLGIKATPIKYVEKSFATPVMAMSFKPNLQAQANHKRFN